MKIKAGFLDPFAAKLSDATVVFMGSKPLRSSMILLENSKDCLLPRDLAFIRDG
jgi:hypothetical protein